MDEIPLPVQPDPLTTQLCIALGISGPDQIVSALYAPEFDRSKIAALAPAVLAAAALDPSIVDEFLRPAGSELALMAIAAARAVGWNSGPLPLAMAGGFLLSSEVIARRSWRIFASTALIPSRPLSPSRLKVRWCLLDRSL